MSVTVGGPNLGRFGIDLGAHLGGAVHGSRPPYVQIAVRVPRELKDRLEQTATRKGRHVIELVRLLLRGDLGQPRATSAGSR